MDTFNMQSLDVVTIIVIMDLDLGTIKWKNCNLSSSRSARRVGYSSGFMLTTELNKTVVP